MPDTKTDLIDRAALKRRLENYRRDCEEAEDTAAEQVFADCICELDDAPTVDAAPVVHARWIKHDGYTECSGCEYWYDSAESEDAGDRSHYCPSCGARMDGEEEQPNEKNA